MNLRLTRRRFGQLAIASTAAAGLTYFANNTFAQTPDLVFVGVSLDNQISSDDTTFTVSDITEVSNTENFTATSAQLGILLPTLNVVTGQVQTPSPVQGVNLQSDDELTGFTSLADGTLVLAITPASTGKKGADPTRLVFLSTPSTTVTVSGLNKQEKLRNLVGTNDGKLLGLVARKSGKPPVHLVEINVQTGAITSSNKINLPQSERFLTLAECPDGKLYTTVVGKQGETSLVELNLGQKKPITIAPLKVNDTVWNNGLENLICSTAGQLFAFGALRYETPNKLYTVNSSNGEMSLIKEFDAAQITLI